jgi:hypothetical protein
MNESTFSPPMQEVRRVGVLFTKYVLWATSLAGLLLVCGTYMRVVQQGLALLDTARQSLGSHRPVSGPDWWLVAGLIAAFLLPTAVVVLIHRAYINTWKARLRRVWQSDHIPPHAQVRRLRPVAPVADIKRRIDYVRALSTKAGWHSCNIPDPGETSEQYRPAAEAMLAELEKDISERAIAIGLVVGASRNRIIDLFTIAAAALELQLHVLTRLGKRPSLAAWREMLTRTASSLFLNCYLNQNESLSLRIAIKKMGMGLEATADMIDHATAAVGNNLTGLVDAHGHAAWDSDDADWDDAEHIFPHSVVGIPIKPLFDVAGLTLGAFVSVGTFGIRELGVFIDKSGDELFQGAMAGGILYFHGMAVAADCLALDKSHRESPAMNRTIRQCTVASSVAAGRVLRDGVRELRKALRERRRRVFTAARDGVEGMAKEVVTEVRTGAENAGTALAHAATTIGAQVHSAASGAGSTLGRVFKHERGAVASTSPTTAAPATGPQVR